MKLRYISILLFALIASAASVYGQATTFSDPNVDYTFQIPDEKWKLVKSGASGDDVEFVYVYRNDGHLEIRKISSPRATPMADLIKEQEDKLQFIQGYVPGKQENFVGKLNGSVFNYEFIRAGRAMSGRFYFLRSGDTVYLLRFTGFQDSLRSLRAQTDVFGRTFELKKN
ncbi:MAG: hypothetical protein ACRD6X_10915 [Pyrinomonadaceae bacterium]